MLDAITDLLKYILPEILDLALRGFFIFLISLTMVYILGRMLGIIEHYKSKNLVAILTASGLSIWSTKFLEVEKLTPQESIWTTIVVFSFAIIFYVLIGFDLYDRFNRACDNKFGDLNNKKRKK